MIKTKKVQKVQEVLWTLLSLQMTFCSLVLSKAQRGGGLLACLLLQLDPSHLWVSFQECDHPMTWVSQTHRRPCSLSAPTISRPQERRGRRDAGGGVGGLVSKHCRAPQKTTNSGGTMVRARKSQSLQRDTLQTTRNKQSSLFKTIKTLSEIISSLLLLLALRQHS